MSDATLMYNPFQPGFSEDPYPHYAELREGDPVHESPFGIWVAFRYEDVQRMLRDRALSVEDRNVIPNERMQMIADAVGAPEEERGNRSMLNRDPPDHTRLRRLVSKAFTPRMVERLRPRIEQLVDEALEGAGPEWDVIDGLAFPLPFQVISELLGTPETDSAQLRQWSGTVVRALEPVGDPEVMTAIIEASNNLQGLVLEIIEWKKANPADDMLSALIAAEEDGDSLSEEELAEQVALLYIAGHETTVNLIGNGTLALLRQRSELQRLQGGEGLAPNWIDELLRFDSPVQSTRRITLEPIELGGREIEAGSFVVLSLASSNRDPAKWGPTAGEVDLGRADCGEHMSFGGGHHLCLGAHLARLEGSAAISRMVRRFPAVELAGDPEWNGRTNLRGMSHLVVRTGA